MAEKATRKSTKPRVLNRWDDDLDKGVLLCVQYACSEAGMKIPWARVAEIMGPTFSEGSIVQHVAKLRQLMANMGVAVPPPIKRGMVTKSPSKIYGSSANPRQKLPYIPPMFPDGTSTMRAKEEEDSGEEKSSIYNRSRRHLPSRIVKVEEGTKEDDTGDMAKTTPAKAKPKPKPKPKGKSRRNMSDDEDDEQAPELYDSDDDEYRTSKKRRQSGAKKATPSKAKASGSKASKRSLDAQASPEVTVKVEDTDEVDCPAARTRGVKRDYTMMTGSDEFDEELDASDNDAKNEEVECVGNEDDAAVNESEAETVILEQNAPVTSAALSPLQPVLTPYGSVFANDEMAASMAHRFQAVNGANGVGFPGMMNGSNPFALNQFNYSGVATMSPMNSMPSMNTMPPMTSMSGTRMSAMAHGPTFNQFPSMSIYTPSSGSPSVAQGTGFTNMASLSNNVNTNSHFSNGINHGFGNTGDVITEQDHMNALPDPEVFFTDGTEFLNDFGDQE